jgi:hypothetical protein
MKTSKLFSVFALIGWVLAFIGWIMAWILASYVITLNSKIAKIEAEKTAIVESCGEAWLKLPISKDEMSRIGE